MTRITTLTSNNLQGFNTNRGILREVTQGTNIFLPSGVTTSSSIRKFNKTSLHFNGDISAFIPYYSLNPLQKVGDGTTIECWMYITEPTRQPWVLSSESYAEGQFLTIFPGTETSISWYGNQTDGSGGTINPSPAVTNMTNRWVHVVLQCATYVVGQPTYVQLFVDGSLIVNASVGLLYSQTVTKNYFQIGGFIKYASPNDMFKGYLDDIRISSGLRYPNGGYTVPTSKLTVDDTTLALFQTA